MRSAPYNASQSAFNQLSTPFSHLICASSIRYGYPGKVVRLLFCNVSACLAEGINALSSNTRNTSAIHMLQEKQVEVGFFSSAV